MILIIILKLSFYNASKDIKLEYPNKLSVQKMLEVTVTKF